MLLLQKSSFMAIPPVTAAEIGVLITQKSETSSWGSRFVSSTFSRDTAKKIMKIVIILLVKSSKEKSESGFPIH